MQKHRFTSAAIIPQTVYMKSFESFTMFSVVSNLLKMLFSTCPQMFCVWLIQLFLLHLFLIEGSSAGIQYEEVCYGGNFRLPFDYTPPVFNGQLYFTPSDGGSRRIVMDNGKVSSFWSYNLCYHQYCYESHDPRSRIWQTPLQMRANEVLNEHRI